MPISKTIERRRVLSRLNEAPWRIAQLIAPAGYGKSVAARQYSENYANSAICDLREIRSICSMAHCFIAALILENPARESSLQPYLLFSSEEAGPWLALLRRLWAQAISASTLFIIENAEYAHANSAIRDFLCSILATRNDNRRALVCTRIAFPLGGFYSHELDDTLIIDTDILAFDDDEIGQLCHLENSTETVRALREQTHGWPILVSFALRERLAHREVGHSSGRPVGVDPSIRRVVEDSLVTLSGRALEIIIAACAIPDFTTRHARLLFGECDDSEFTSLLPLVQLSLDDSLPVHPAVREVLLQKYRQLAKELLLRMARGAWEDGAVYYAASLCLHAGNPKQAASMLPDSSAAPMPEPPEDLIALIQQLKTHELCENPRLWCYVALLRSLSLPTERWLHEVHYIWNSHRQTLSPDDLSRMLIPIIFGYMRLGRARDAEVFLQQYCQHVGDVAMTTPMVKLAWTVILSFLGKLVDIDEIYSSMKVLEGSPGWEAVTLNDLVARSYCLLCDRPREREIALQSIELARHENTSFALTWCAVDAAFSAWMFGEDEMFIDCMNILERGTTPMTEGSVAHFIDCVRGRGIRSQTRHERLKTRSNGWMIAAANASDEFERLTLARRAVVAADQSAQPYYKIISRLALGMCDLKNAKVHFVDAQNLAASLPSPRLQSAVDLICEGAISGPLAPLARRFKASPQRRVLISIVRGETVEEQKVVPLSPREHELVTFFMLERRPLTRQEIVSALWPDADDDSGRNQLKTLITTLRARFADKQTVVFSPPFYSLARWFRGDIGDIEAALRADSADDASLEILREYYTQLRHRQRLREDRWEWFPPYAYRLEQLEREVGSKCARMYLFRNEGHAALEIARMMVASDPHDVSARALVVQAYAHMGLATQARQEIEEYRRIVRDELGIEDDGGELYALFNGMRINPKKTSVSRQGLASEDFVRPATTSNSELELTVDLDTP